MQTWYLIFILCDFEIITRILFQSEGSDDMDEETKALFHVSELIESVKKSDWMLLGSIWSFW
jgi:hypothetical protein